MPEMIPLGWFHTVMGVIALVSGVITLAEVRRDARFIDIAERAGLTVYWSDTGRWPDFCDDPKLQYNCADEFGRKKTRVSSRTDIK